MSFLSSFRNIDFSFDYRYFKEYTFGISTISFKFGIDYFSFGYRSIVWTTIVLRVSVEKENRNNRSIGDTSVLILYPSLER